jgi:hypothetical protein
MLGITTTNARVGGFRGGILAEAKTIYNRIIADGGVSNLTRLNFFVKGLKAIYGDLANVPVCYDAHWIGYKLGSGTGATSGQAAAKLYSLTVAGDAVQATAASQPLLLAHNGASSDNYWFSPLSVTDNCSTPNAVANQIIGDVEFIFNFSFYSVANANFISKRSGGSNVSYAVNTQFQGKPILTITQNGSTLITATSSTAITTATNWLKVIRTQSSGDVIFYTSTDGVTYTQLGTTQSTTSGNMFNGTSALTLGNNAVNGGDGMGGKMFRATIANSIGGTPVVDFNPATYNAATSQTQWTSTTGEVWTINTGTATSGYKGVLVNRTMVQSDGVDDSMTSGTLASANYFSSYIAFNPKKFDTSKYIIDGSSNDNHYIYTGGSGIKFGEISYVGGAQNVLNLYSGDFNNTNTKIRVNNANEQSGIFVTIPTTSLKLFSRSNGLLCSNTNINTLVFSASIDTDTTKTATYNLIRSLNNNAF